MYQLNRYLRIVSMLIGTQLISCVVAVAQNTSPPDPLPEFALMRQGSVRLASPDGVLDLILSKDGMTLVSFGRNVIGWDVKTGRELWRRASSYLPAAYGNRAVTLAADGAHFLEFSEGSITEWDILKGENRSIPVDMTLGGGRVGEGARCIDVSADGRLLFCGSGLGYTIYNRDFEPLYNNTALLPELNSDGDRLAFGGPYAYGRFSQDGQRLALVTSQDPKTVKILEASTGELLRTIHCIANVVRMEFRPDSSHLAITERDTAVRLYDTTSSMLIWQCVFDVDKRSENYTSALAYTPDGKHLFVCERNQTIFKVDAESGQHIGTIENHSWNPWALAVSHDGRSFYSSGWGGTIHHWNSETLQALPLPVGYRGTDAITLSPDGKLCASVDQAGAIHLVDRDSQAEVDVFHLPEARFDVVEFSQDSQFLCAGGSWAGEVHVVEWSLQTQEATHHWRWPIGNDPVTGVEDIVYAPSNDRILVSIFRQSASYLLDRRSELRLKLPHRSVYGSTFSIDGTKVFTAGWNKQVRAWDGFTGELLREKTVESEHNDSRMYTVSADPTGRYLATAGMSASVALYQPDSLELIREWDVSGSFVFGALRFSPDGLWIASGDGGGDIDIWDPDTGEKVHGFKGHDAHVYTIDFGSDNRTLCSGGANLGYVWSLRPTDVRFGSIDEAIHGLVGLDSSESYRAWWYLVDNGDSSVPKLAEFCDGVSEFVDLQAVVSGLDEAQRERRMRLLRRMIENDGPTLVTHSAVRRINSVLAHIDTDSSRAALLQLAQRADAFSSIRQ